VNLSDPLADVLPGARGRVLAALVRRSEPATLRAVARAAHTSPQRTSEIVDELEAAGIVTVRLAGRARMVALNHEHLAYEPVRALAQLRSELMGRLRAEVRTWHDLRAAWLYGSAARGDGRLDSDIDVLLVGGEPDRDTWRRREDRLVERIQAWTGNRAEVHTYEEAEFRRLVRRNVGLIDGIRQDGVVISTPRRTADQLIRR
jgi:predicted nucleotidyltransferase